MPIINEYNALTGENKSIEITDAEHAAMIANMSSNKSMSDMIAENEALKASAIGKLAAL